nr:uncharacterized protein LOC108081293 [Drosophila kikkawai]
MTPIQYSYQIHHFSSNKMAYLVRKLLGLLLCLKCVIELQDINIGIVDYCEMKTLSQTKNSFIMRYNFNKPMMNNIWFLINLMTRSSENHNGESIWQPYLYPTNIDLCRVMKNRYNHVAKMVLDLIKGHSNLNHSCPYLVILLSKEKYLAIDDITNTEISTRLRGIPMAKGNYSLYAKWIRENKTLVQTNFYFEVLSN